MSLQSTHELEVTGRKLEELDQLYEGTLPAAGENAYARDLTLRSLPRRIKQFTEEIARLEAWTGSTNPK